MPAIQNISIEGFRSLRRVELELRPLNLMIGGNGSGKSNFLGALHLLRSSALSAARFFDEVDRFGGAERLLHFGSKVTDDPVPSRLHGWDVPFQGRDAPWRRGSVLPTDLDLRT